MTSGSAAPGRGGIRRYRRMIYHISRQEWMREFILHVLTGVLTVVAHYSLMWVLLRVGMPALPASGLGFLAGAATRYILSYTKVFSPADGVPATLRRFIVALGLQWVANLLLLGMFLRLDLPTWWAQVLATVLLTVLNFVMYRFWVFRA